MEDFLEFYESAPKLTHAPGLDVMRALLTRLGEPQRALPCVHVAGTNGKGSTAAMLSAILRADGWRTGLYTSPHLCDFTERIRVDEVNITYQELAAVTERVRRACEGLDTPSYFERATAAALLYFAERACDAVVLETGLGGRLDPTNVIEVPLCSVITPIGFDHTAQLGNTLSAIAGEKAGIIKPGRPVVCAPQAEEAADVIRREARRLESPLAEVDITKIDILARSPAGQRFSYGKMCDIFLSLLGDYQAVNAACAIEAARVLGIGEDAIRAGLASAAWPCRFEYFAGTPPVVLDGAHNGHGAAALSGGLRAYFPGQRHTMVMGVMADKDIPLILSLTEPLAARFICLAPENDRALSPAALASMIKSAPALAADGPEQALALARSFGDPICAFGSLYYIGQMRSLIAKETEP